MYCLGTNGEKTRYEIGKKRGQNSLLSKLHYENKNNHLDTILPQQHMISFIFCFFFFIFLCRLPSITRIYERAFCVNSTNAVSEEGFVVVLICIQYIVHCSLGPRSNTLFIAVWNTENTVPHHQLDYGIITLNQHNREITRMLKMDDGAEVFVECAHKKILKWGISM